VSGEIFYKNQQIAREHTDSLCLLNFGARPLLDSTTNEPITMLAKRHPFTDSLPTAALKAGIACLAFAYLFRPIENESIPPAVDILPDVPYLASSDLKTFAAELLQCSQPGPETKRLVADIPFDGSPVDRLVSIYVYLKDRWTYCSDPENGKQQWNQSCEYSVRSGFKGDCEDFGCMVFAALSVADVSARLVMTETKSGGHCFCEALIGSDSLRSRALLGDIAKRLQMNKIAYRVVDGKIYLALDFGLPDRRVYQDRIFAVVEESGVVIIPNRD